jgi:hypothetical protein
MSQDSQTLRAAWITARYLVPAVLVGGGLGAIFQRVPISGLLSVGIVSVAAGSWGRSMVRLTDLGHERRVAWAAALAVGPSVVLVGVSLAAAESTLIPQSADASLPIHVVFSLLFVPAALLVAAIGGFALGSGARGVRLGASLAVRAGTVRWPGIPPHRFGDGRARLARRRAARGPTSNHGGGHNVGNNRGGAGGRWRPRAPVESLLG